VRLCGACFYDESALLDAPLLEGEPSHCVYERGSAALECKPPLRVGVFG